MTSEFAEHSLTSAGEGASVSYSRLVREYWPVIVAGALLGLFAAYGFLSLRAAAYTSQTSVLVSPTGVDEPVAVSGARTGGPLNMDTEAQVALSDDVLTRAKAVLKSPESVQVLRGRVSVSVPPNTEILGIAFVTSEPSSSQAGSTAVAQAYLAARDELAKKTLLARTVALENQSTALQQQLVAAEAAVAATSATSPERPAADAQRSRVQSDLSSSDSELSALKRTQVTPGQIVALPTQPTSDRNIIVLVSLFSGPFAGLLLGVGMALVLQRLRPLIRDVADVEALTHYPVVLRLPKGVRSTATSAVARSPAGQAYARLRNQVMRMTRTPPKTVLVAAVTPSATAHAVARNLAEVLVGESGRATLVCTDSTNPQLCQAQGSSASAHVEVGDAVVERLRRADRSLPSLQKLAHEPGDMVVVHAPAFSELSEAQTLAISVDVVLLVVEQDVTVPEHLQDAILQLNAVRARAVGILVTPRGRLRLRSGRRRRASYHSRDGLADIAMLPLADDATRDPLQDQVPDRLVPMAWPGQESASRGWSPQDGSARDESESPGSVTAPSTAGREDATTLQRRGPGGLPHR